MAYTLEEAKAELRDQYKGKCPDCSSALKEGIGTKYSPKVVGGMQIPVKVFVVKCTNPKCPEHFEHFLQIAEEPKIKVKFDNEKVIKVNACPVCQSKEFLTGLTKVYCNNPMHENPILVQEIVL